MKRKGCDVGGLGVAERKRLENEKRRKERKSVEKNTKANNGSGSLDLFFSQNFCYSILKGPIV